MTGLPDLTIQITHTTIKEKSYPKIIILIGGTIHITDQSQPEAQ